MYYYAHHIGDFNSATRHLSRIERSLYRDLIDLYYDTEQPLTDNLDRLSRLIMASTEEETNGLVYVLSEFFTLEADGYRSKRCDEEIAEYHRKADTARVNGKKGGRPKQPNPNPEITQSVILANPTLTQTKANQEPVTSNQEPRTIKKKYSFDEFWNAFEYKDGRKASEKVWSRIKMDDSIFKAILSSASKEAARRPALRQKNTTPKMAQGWLTEERWNDSIYAEMNGGSPDDYEEKCQKVALKFYNMGEEPAQTTPKRVHEIYREMANA